MITKEQIEKIIVENINDNCFIVDISVSADNSIKVLVDTKEGIAVKECIQLSRIIEQSFDREVEDYSLEVSSPGLDAPFRVFQQYEKNINREVEVVKKDGQKIVGKLLSANKDDIKIEEKKKVKVEGKKKKQLVVKEYKILLTNIKSSKVLISFK